MLKNCDALSESVRMRYGGARSLILSVLMDMYRLSSGGLRYGSEGVVWYLGSMGEVVASLIWNA